MAVKPLMEQKVAVIPENYILTNEVYSIITQKPEMLPVVIRRYQADYHDDQELMMHGVISSVYLDEHNVDNELNNFLRSRAKEMHDAIRRTDGGAHLVDKMVNAPTVVHYRNDRYDGRYDLDSGVFLRDVLFTCYPDDVESDYMQRFIAHFGDMIDRVNREITQSVDEQHAQHIQAVARAGSLMLGLK